MLPSGLNQPRLDGTTTDRRNAWLRGALLVGLVYLVAGLVFASLAAAAASHQMRVAWRLVAWVVSAGAFGAHIWYEQVRLGSTPRALAWHAAAAVALGAFGLAVAANVHAFTRGVGNRQLLLGALIAWPVLCGIPAFVVALAAGVGMTRLRRTTPV